MRVNKSATKMKKGLLAGFLSLAALTLSGCIKVDATYVYEGDNTSSMIVKLTDISGEGDFLEDPSDCEDATLGYVPILHAFSDESEKESLPTESAEGYINDDGQIECVITNSNFKTDIYDEGTDPLEVIEAEDEDSFTGRIGDEFHIITTGQEALSLSEFFYSASAEDYIEEMTLQYTFPGEVIEHSSGRLSKDKRTVIFDKEDPFFAPKLTIVASAIPQEGNKIVELILPIVGLLMFLGVAISGVFLVRKNRSSKQERDDSDDEELLDQGKQHPHHPANPFENTVNSMSFDEEGFSPNYSAPVSPTVKELPPLPPPPPFLKRQE